MLIFHQNGGKGYEVFESSSVSVYIEMHVIRWYDVCAHIYTYIHHAYMYDISFI